MPLQWGKPCGGMKRKNENQVGVNQNYQPSKKNDNFEIKKRMHREKENVGTRKNNSKMYQQCTNKCSRIRENNKKP